jgi:hypothetical protein
MGVGEIRWMIIMKVDILVKLRPDGYTVGINVDLYVDVYLYVDLDMDVD